MAAPNKAHLIEQVLAELKREQDTLLRAAQEAYVGATHAEVKQENKYDTRGLESSYLALGQSKRAQEIGENMERIRILLRESKASAEKVAPGALVRLEKEDGSPHWYLLLPGTGGFKVSDSGVSVQVISLSSPLGLEILGKEIGDEIRFQKTVQTLISSD